MGKNVTESSIEHLIYELSVKHNDIKSKLIDPTRLSELEESYSVLVNKLNKAINLVTIYYLTTDKKKVTKETEGWSTEFIFPTSSKRYVWTYLEFQLIDGTITYSTPALTCIYYSGSSDTDTEGILGVYVDLNDGCLYANTEEDTPYTFDIENGEVVCTNNVDNTMPFEIDENGNLLYKSNN